MDKPSVIAFATRERDAYEKPLKALVEIPSVSSGPARVGDIRRCADYAAGLIRLCGGEAKLVETKCNPIVHGRFFVAHDVPTVTIYNPHDVQPASRDTEPLDSDPFIFTKVGDRYFGRGTTDDKGPALTALWGVKAARENGVRVNINLLWELEEEIGSGNFEAAVRENAKLLTTDSVLVSDTIWVSRQQPACPAGLRGLQGFELVLETGTTDQHSGTTGGAARNPIGELMKLVSEMYDATTGKVKIKGFYDDVEPPSKRELQEFRDSGFSIKKFKKDHLFKSIRTEDPVDVMKRIWAMPTFEIHGVTGGYQGPGINTTTPPRATVKVSCRLVAHQDPKKIMRLIRDFVKERNPDVKIAGEAAMLPYMGPTTGPLADAVKTAMKFAFGREPVFVREGGPIGAVVWMEKVLRCPVMFLGLSLPVHGYHAPNATYTGQHASAWE